MAQMMSSYATNASKSDALVDVPRVILRSQCSGQHISTWDAIRRGDGTVKATSSLWPGQTFDGRELGLLQRLPGQEDGPRHDSAQGRVFHSAEATLVSHQGAERPDRSGPR